LTDDALIKALENIAVHLKYLGVGDAGTTMGAIEFLAVKNYEGAALIASALDNLADAVRMHDGHCPECCFHRAMKANE
jgi:hypothetical protein